MVMNYSTSKRQDPETEAMLYQGASLSQIGTLFSMDTRDIKAKIHGQVQPVGTRSGSPIYSIKEVAQYLVQPPYDMDEFIQRMSIADLPTILRKEFWAGMRSRQLYEIEAGELWPTDDVVEALSTLFKTLRMQLLLIKESVERETELTERQRDIVTRITDKALDECYAETTRKFPAIRAATDTATVLPAEDTSSEEL